MTSKLTPKISIITITYNAEDTIEKTIQSVLEQEYKNIEYIIIDGNSADATMDIVGKYKNDIDFIMSEPDKGIYDAMNKGISYASGEWINFLNAGDVFYNKKTISMIFNKLSNDNKIVYGDWINVNNNGLKRYIKSNHTLNFKALRSKFQMNHQALFVNTKNLPKYNLTYKIKADYQWVIDIVKMTSETEIVYLEKPLVLYDIDGISANMMMLNLKEYISLTYHNFGIRQVLLNSRVYLYILLKFIVHKYVYKSY